MALPIAQLGYMPNMNAPSRGGKTIVEDPWAKIAQLVLTNVATQAAGNLMSKDYSNQAQTEGLVPNGGPAGDTPDNAPWYKKMLTGPTMNERQFTSAQNRMSDRDTQRTGQKFAVEEAEKGRQFQTQRDNSRTLQEADQFNRTIALQQGEQDYRRTQGDRASLLQGAALENDRARTDIARNPPAPQADPDTNSRVVGSMAAEIYKSQYELWARAAQMAQYSGQPPPPQPTFSDAYNQAADAVESRMGIKAQPGVRAPAVPLIQ